MSSESHEQIAIRVRRRLGLPASAALTLQPLVDVALRKLCYDLALDPSTRHWVLTDPASTTVVLDGSGVADLSALITSPRIMLECLQYGDILPPVGYPSTQPFRMIDNEGQGQIPGAYDALIYKCWLDGHFLHTRSADGNVTPLAGTISLSVPYWQTLAQLDDSLVERLVMSDYWLLGKDQDAA